MVCRCVREREGAVHMKSEIEEVLWWIAMGAGVIGICAVCMLVCFGRRLSRDEGSEV